MKLSDYVASFLAAQGIRYVFVITGGAAAHLIDSVAKNPNIDYICTQHEQAAAMAADAYSRVTGNIGAAIATSGPGEAGYKRSLPLSIPSKFKHHSTCTFFFGSPADAIRSGKISIGIISYSS